jgi:hypothetical protein
MHPHRQVSRGIVGQEESLGREGEADADLVERVRERRAAGEQRRPDPDPAQPRTPSHRLVSDSRHASIVIAPPMPAATRVPSAAGESRDEGWRIA